MTLSADQIEIPQISLETEIGRGAQTVVYRATRGGQTVAVKLRREGLGADDRDTNLLFRREAALLACLKHPGLPQIIEVSEVDGRPYLVMEFVDGETLASTLDASALDETQIVELARAIAGALAEVHRHGLIHRDIKPQNILIDRQGGAKLIDFGFATRIGQPEKQDSIVGTFLYSPPEQSGMLSRPMDGRSDLYSLGVVLYECATGRTPFQASDVGELIRQHAVEQPPDIRTLRPQLSRALAAIIHKLFNKDPDDRYQSGDGLLADLDQLDRLNQKSDTPVSQRLGQGDRGRQRLYEAPLVGRERELAKLVHQWNEARRGGGTVVVVEGEPGSGKSRLVREFIQRLRLYATVSMSGKCTDADPMPFAPLRLALDGLIRQWQKLTEHQAIRLLNEIKVESKEIAPLLKRFSPGLGRLFSEAPDLPPHSELQEQFYDAIADFIRLVAHKQGEGLLFIDDVQWLDEASREVLVRLTSRLESVPLLIVITGRNEGVHREQLGRTLERVYDSISLRLVLDPLGETAVADLIESHLGGGRIDKRFISQMVTRTNGSPFAVGEYVRALLDAGLLQPSWGSWVVDRAGLESISLPSDVVQLVVQRIDQLGEETQHVLSTAAVIGSRFNIDLLPAICSEAVSVYGAIAEAARARLIEQGDGSMYGFVHDRVREALLGELTDAARQKLHQQIAEVMDLVPEEEPDHIYSLARHYARGHTDSNPGRVYETNLAAGIGAQNNFANEEALHFFECARSAAEASGMTSVPDLDEAMGWVCARTRRFQEAVGHLEQAVATTDGAIHRARLYRKLAQIHGAKIDLTPAWQAIENGFSELGARAPTGNAMPLTGALLSWLVHVPERRLGWNYGSVKAGEQHDRIEILAQLHEEAGFLAFFQNREGIMLESTVRSLEMTHRLGPSRELVNCYCSYAVILAMLKRRKRADHYIRQAIEIARQLGDRTALARAMLFQAWAQEFSGRHRAAEVLSRRALEEYSRWIDGMDYVNGVIELAWNLEMRGYTREAWNWIQRGMARLKYHGGDPEARDHPHGYDYAASLLATLGRPTEALSFLSENEAFLEKTPDYLYAMAEFLAHKLLYYVEQGELGEPLLETIAAHNKLGLKPGGTPLFLRHFYVWQGYARSAICEKASGPGRERTLTEFAEALKELRSAASVPLLRCHLRVQQASLLRLRGREKAAWKKLDRAADLAREVDCPWVAFEVARQRGLIMLQAENNGAAGREAHFAHELAVEHGWTFRARHIRSTFQVVSTSLEQTGFLRTRVADSSSLKLQRHLDALLQVSMASARVLDPEQQARVALDEIVRILGAERAFLFWVDDTNGQLELKAGRDSQGHSLSELKGYSSTVVQRVRDSGEPLIVSGTEEGAILGSESAVAHDLRSIVAVPLQIREQLVGVVYLDNRLATGIFTEDDVEILRAIAGHIAISQDTARTARLEIQYESERQRRRLAEILRDLTTALNSTLDLKQVLDRLLEAMSQMIPFERALGLMRKGEEYRVMTSAGYSQPEQLQRIRISPSDDDYFAEMALTQRPLCIDDTEKDEHFEEYGPDRGLRSWMGVPLLAGPEMVGVLLLARSEPESYGDPEADIAFTFAGQAVIAIENARLFGEIQRLAVTDELTSTHNRRHFFNLAHREFARARRYNRPLSLLMVDIDHFKAVNDTYGHGVGDAVLKVIATRCQSNIRDLDILGRYGGEEFIILLPEIGAETAHTVVAERLRACVADNPVSTEQGPINMTLSVGVAELDPQMEELKQLVQQADEALYRAKETGRNLVVRYSPPAPPTDNSD